MSDTLHLNIILTPPPADAPPRILATVSLQNEVFGQRSPADLLENPLTEEEEEHLRWYLEEYWKWPYEQFRERGEEIEELLPVLGKRLYQAVFGSSGAQQVLQPWRLQPATPRQINIVCDMPRILRLPWELLHDEQGFLALRAQHPISIVRCLSQQELPVLPSPFKPPLRILLVTARPDDAGFIDPRSIARELLDVVSEQIEMGSIALEFLRPPTLPALRKRLGDPMLPLVQVVHFDGHGAFGPEPIAEDGLRLKVGGPQHGMLAFENEQGLTELVGAGELAQVLQHSGVRLAVFNACQSAVSDPEDVFSSVATRLVQGGIGGVVAMSASVLVPTATRYVAAFYHALTMGVSVPQAHERGRQALHDDSRRHLTRRSEEAEGEPVRLRDWWLPHYYQQRALVLEPASVISALFSTRSSRKRMQSDAPLPVLSASLPAEPCYRFSGRAPELLRIERALWQKKLVVIHGFGGIGKTALAREAAEWFTRIGLYRRACFVSFEAGGESAMLLSQLGSFLGIYDGEYNPGESTRALARIQRVVKAQQPLLIVDNLESILPSGEAALDTEERTCLWQVLLDLRAFGVGVMLTTRDVTFGDSQLAPGKVVMHLRLQGLYREDAYELASHVLADLGIERSHAPYTELRALLTELDHHPLAIQLVLPALCDRSLATIRADFARLLSTFVDDAITGRNRSLLASLDYSLRRLPQEQRTLLARLALFEGGTSEDNLLAITQISQETWALLRLALEQAALLVAERIHEAITTPFLHFHPVLLPYLRQEAEVHDEAKIALYQRYTQRFVNLADDLALKAFLYPDPVYKLVRYELPNFRKALALLSRSGHLEATSHMTDELARFLTHLGLTRERDQLRQCLEQVIIDNPASGGLTYAFFVHEVGKAEDEQNSGRIQAAFARLTRLLAHIQALPQGTKMGPDSYAHCLTLRSLGYCLRKAGKHTAALEQFRIALSCTNVLLVQGTKDSAVPILRANLFRDLGDVLRDLGQYTEAQSHYEQALVEHTTIRDALNEAITLERLGTLALLRQDYHQARLRYQQALAQYQARENPILQAVALHQLGLVAEAQNDWIEAERCYRKSLVLEERVGDTASAAGTTNQLGILARNSNRLAEAEGWYRGALERIERVEPGGMQHATYMSNLANLLMEKVFSGREQVYVGHTERRYLAEARLNLERVLQIWKQPGVSAEIWNTYNLLAVVAELEGQSERARDYRQKEHETFVASEDNRAQFDQKHALLVEIIVASARGNMQAQSTIMASFSALEEEGWNVKEGIKRIWRGERDWQTITEELDREDSLLFLRVLETLAEIEAYEQQAVPTLEQLLAALPPSIQVALEQGDEVALQQAFTVLSPKAQQQVAAILTVLTAQQDEASKEPGP